MKLKDVIVVEKVACSCNPLILLCCEMLIGNLSSFQFGLDV